MTAVHKKKLLALGRLEMGYDKQISVARWQGCADDEAREHRICREGFDGCLTRGFHANKLQANGGLAFDENGSRECA